MSEESVKTFVSYSREDSDFVMQLAKDLRDAGAMIWLDQLDIIPGMPWDTQVEIALRNCVQLLVVLSPASVNSQNVLDEVSYVMDANRRVIPLLCSDCSVPLRLRRLQYIDFRADYAAGLKDLLGTLNIVLPITRSDLNRRGTSIKYYLYISDAKLEMLYRQIPEREKRKIAADLDIEFSQLNTASTGVTQTETRYSRLMLVVAYIQQYENVGTIDKPSNYFSGVLPMSWGPLVSVYPSKMETVVWFAGQTDQTILGLGGSKCHAIGVMPSDSLGPNLQSALPFLVDALLPGGDFEGKVDQAYLRDFLKISKAESVKDQLALNLVYTATIKMMQTHPSQRLEFLAKRLLSGTLPSAYFENQPSATNRKEILLGTPIYVSLVE